MIEMLNANFSKQKIKNFKWILRKKTTVSSGPLTLHIVPAGESGEYNPQIQP